MKVLVLSLSYSYLHFRISFLYLDLALTILILFLSVFDCPKRVPTTQFSFLSKPMKFDYIILTEKCGAMTSVR